MRDRTPVPSVVGDGDELPVEPGTKGLDPRTRVKQLLDPISEGIREEGSPVRMEMPICRRRVSSISSVYRVPGIENG